MNDTLTCTLASSLEFLQDLARDGALEPKALPCSGGFPDENYVAAPARPQTLPISGKRHAAAQVPVVSCLIRAVALLWERAVVPSQTMSIATIHELFSVRTIRV